MQISALAYINWYKCWYLDPHRRSRSRSRTQHDFTHISEVLVHLFYTLMSNKAVNVHKQIIKCSYLQFLSLKSNRVLWPRDCKLQACVSCCDVNLLTHRSGNDEVNDEEKKDIEQQKHPEIKPVGMFGQSRHNAPWVFHDRTRFPLPVSRLHTFPASDALHNKSPRQASHSNWMETWCCLYYNILSRLLIQPILALLFLNFHLNDMNIHKKSRQLCFYSTSHNKHFEVALQKMIDVNVYNVFNISVDLAGWSCWGNNNIMYHI